LPVSSTVADTGGGHCGPPPGIIKNIYSWVMFAKKGGGGKKEETYSSYKSKTIYMGFYPNTISVVVYPSLVLSIFSGRQSPKRIVPAKPQRVPSPYDE
jgi:hypothetical protein